MITEADLERFVDRLLALPKELEKAEHDNSLLQDDKKHILALEMIEAEQRGHKTVSAQEREAYASPGYKTHCEGAAVAHGALTRLKREFDVCCRIVDLYRTQESSRRGMDRVG
jgi:hypothetical protein